MREEGSNQKTVSGAARQFRWTSNVSNPGYTPKSNNDTPAEGAENQATGNGAFTTVAKRMARKSKVSVGGTKSWVSSFLSGVQRLL